MNDALAKQFAGKDNWFVEYAQIQQKFLSIKKKLEILQQIKLQLKETAKLTKNIPQYKKGCKQLFTKFLGLLNFQNFKNVIPKPKGVKYYMIVGQISAGKSSLINFYYGLNESIGVGETTAGPRVVKKFMTQLEEQVYVWDTPGKNEEFNILSYETLGYFASADKIFLISETGAKSVISMAEVISKINPLNLYFIRTKSDMWEEDHIQTLEDYRKNDKILLLERGISVQGYFQIGGLIKQFQKHQVYQEVLKEFDNRKLSEKLNK